MSRYISLVAFRTLWNQSLTLGKVTAASLPPSAILRGGLFGKHLLRLLNLKVLFTISLSLVMISLFKTECKMEGESLA